MIDVKHSTKPYQLFELISPPVPVISTPSPEPVRPGQPRRAPWRHKHAVHAESAAESTAEHGTLPHLPCTRSRGPSSRQIARARTVQGIRTENVPGHGGVKCDGQNSVRISASGPHLVLYDELW